MSGFTAKTISRLFPAATERTYDSGQLIIYNGDKPVHVAFLISGAYKFHDTDLDGNEKILHIGGPQSFFPLFYSFEDKAQVDGFYTTLAKCRFLYIPLADFREKLKTDPEFTYRILSWYAQEMDHIVLRLKSLEKSTAKHKLLQALAYLLDQHSVVRRTGRSTWFRITFEISQQTLASMTGLTRETVNATLKELEKINIVRTPKKMALEINKSNLDALLDQD